MIFHNFRFLDIGSLIISAIGTWLTVLLVYYGIRTLRLFKTNVAARAWTYISISAVFFAIGVVMFVIDDIQLMGLIAIGGVMQTVGGVLMVLGLRKNYLFRASKDHLS